MAERKHSMETVEYASRRCVRMSNSLIELIATTDVGPRIIRVGFIGGPNLFAELPDVGLDLPDGRRWNIYGGHRLWHAPEHLPRTYSADNEPVRVSQQGTMLTLEQAPEPDTGIAKVMQITLDGSRDCVTVVHRLTNYGPWAVELAPWALSVMAPGGRAILPQEPYRPPTEQLLPSRPIVLWSYTDMSDPRWTWGKRYIQLRQDASRPAPQKIGVANSLGWAAYTLSENVFVKRFAFDRHATYADMGCNFEMYTNGRFLELESLGPLTKLEPGATVEHTESWLLLRAKVGDSEDEIDRQLLPLLERES